MKTDELPRVARGARRLRARAPRRRRARRARGPPRGLPRAAGPRLEQLAARRATCSRSPTRPASARRRSPPRWLGKRSRPRSAASGAPNGAAPAAASASASAAPPRRRRRRCWPSSSSPAASDAGPSSTSPSARCRRGQDRREAEPQRLRDRDPHVRQGRPLGHPLPRLPARPQTATTLSAGTFRYRWGDGSFADPQLRASTSRAPSDRRPRRRPHLRRAASDDARQTLRKQPDRRNRREEDTSAFAAAGADRACWRSPAAAAAATALRARGGAYGGGEDIDRQAGGPDRPEANRRTRCPVGSGPKLGKVSSTPRASPSTTSTRTRATTSTCYGACAAGLAAADDRRRAAGRRRRDGLEAGHDRAQRRHTQVTYAGRPLYTYVEDKKPGEANGNDINSFGASWYALEPERRGGRGLG